MHGRAPVQTGRLTACRARRHCRNGHLDESEKRPQETAILKAPPRAESISPAPVSASALESDCVLYPLVCSNQRNGERSFQKGAPR